MLKLLLLLCPLLLFSSPVVAQAEHTTSDFHETPTLSVTGRGEVFAEPDQAVIQVGVSTEAVTAREAQESVNATIQRVLDALAGLAIDPKQIQTSQLSLQPVYGEVKSRREASEPRLVAYSASYTLSVKTNDLTKISAVIDTALEAGANQLRGVGFELKDEQAARKEALQRAVADALEKGEIVAEAAGTQLVRVLTIMEGGAVVRPAMMARSALMAAEVSGSPAPVMPGQVTVSGQVTVRYQIREE